MGLELKCVGRWKQGGQMAGDEAEVVGKLHVDSRLLSFSGGGQKWELALGAGLKLSENAGWMRVARGRKAAEFQVGDAYKKWEKKILHPPSLRTKLGLQPGMRIWLDGDLTVDLEGCEPVSRLADADLGLLVLAGREDLDRFRQLAGTKRPVWVIYPKGGVAIKEAEVMETARQMAMGASKTAAISERLTGMRFMQKQ